MLCRLALVVYRGDIISRVLSFESIPNLSVTHWLRKFDSDVDGTAFLRVETYVYIAVVFKRFGLFLVSTVDEECALHEVLRIAEALTRLLLCL